MKPRLKEIAEKADVSITTVSMVLAGKGRISKDVRQSVWDIAHGMGYQRKKTGSSNSAKKSSTIGIIISIDKEWAFIWGFLRPIIDEIEQNLRTEGKNTILIPIHHNAPTEEIFNTIIQSGVVSVISLHYGNEALLSSLEELDIPTILVMNNNFQDKFYSVLVDDIQCAFEGTMHLVGLGHKNIAYIECARPDLPFLLNDRFFGFRKAMEECAMKMPDDWILRFDLDNREDLKSKLTGLFSGQLSDRVTGIFCLDDDIALRVINILTEMNVRIPEDVSIIAPGDVLDYSQSFIPDITTMRINTAYMGKIIYQMLMNRMEHKPEDLHVLKVKHQLVRRGTCCPPEQL